MILFLKKDPAEFSNTVIANNAAYSLGSLRVVIWRPTLFSIKPHNISWFPFLIWYIFHIVHIFKSSDYRVYLLYSGDDLIHRSCVFPAFFRFPFMNRGDVQVGDIWTDPEYRSKGLSKYVLNLMINDFQCRRIWYLCNSDNASSIALAKSVGFSLNAIGLRSSRFGVKALGTFSITEFLC